MNLYDDNAETFESLEKWEPITEKSPYREEVAEMLCQYWGEKLNGDLDLDFIRVHVGKDKTTFDVFVHKYTLAELKEKYPDYEIRSWVDDSNSVYNGDKYYVIRM